MNKQSIATILGLALMGLAKKGSSAKIPLDDYFKKKTGNESQTFKIYFSFHYAPFWDDMSVMYDFDEYVDTFIDFVNDVVNGFESYMEDGGEYDFGDWCSEEDMYWMDQLASEWYDFSDWKDMNLLLNNSRFHLPFSEPVSAYDIEYEDQLQKAAEAKYIIDRATDFLQLEEEVWGDKLSRTLYKEWSIGDLEWENKEEFDGIKSRLLSYKEELKELLEEKREEIFGEYGEWGFDWEDEINENGGYLEGFLECKLNSDTSFASLLGWASVIESCLENGYSEWYRQEKPSNTMGDSSFSDFSISKVEPNIFFKFSKNKSKLRRR